MSALFTVSSEATSTKQNRGDDDKAPVDFRYLPTAEEIESVDWLKSELDKRRMTEDFPEDYKDYVFGDTKILRFLRGRKHVREKALHGLIKHVQWRKENSADNITVDDIQLEAQKRPCFVEGKDENGRPLVYLLAGRHDKNDRDIDIMKKYIIYTIEQSLAENKIDEHDRFRDERLNIIFDLTYFGTKSMDYEVVKLLVDTLQYNYPDVLECGYVVNGPFIFNAFWSMVKPWLDPITVKKICFCNADQLQDRFPGGVSSEFGQGPLLSPRPLEVPASPKSFVKHDSDTFLLPPSPTIRENPKRVSHIGQED